MKAMGGKSKKADRKQFKDMTVVKWKAATKARLWPGTVQGWTTLYPRT